MRLTKVSIAAALLTSLVVTACSSNKDDVAVASRIKNIFKRSEAPKLPDPQQIADMINTSLQSSDGPLTLIAMENAASIAILRQIETNGAYRTWAVLGNSERRSISTKRGLVTATRGLGGDLMSSDVDAVLSLIGRRQEGQAQRTQRFLNGEYQISDETANCTVSRGGVQKVVAGKINQNATQVTVHCQVSGQEYTNVHLVSSQGRVLQSRQWLGPTIGYVTLQALR